MNDAQWTTLTVDGIISKTPVYIFQIVMSSHSGKVGEAVFYDGESTNDPKITELRAIANSAGFLTFTPPLKTQRGLYVDMGGDVHTVLVNYSAVKE